jgi:hypothetical protein
MVDVNYAGRVYQLPLIVSERPDIDNLLGRRWFPAVFTLGLEQDFSLYFLVEPHNFSQNLIAIDD